MHSRIFQIADYAVPADEYIGTNDIPEWFTNEQADYVKTSNRAEDIAYFRELYNGVFAFSPDGWSFTITEDSKRRYFAEAYKAFIEAATTLASTSPDEFIMGSSQVYNAIYSVDTAFRRTGGFWVSDARNEVRPLDDFVREARVGATYYLCGTLDYHY